jgi:hypothetical protein
MKRTLTIMSLFVAATVAAACTIETPTGPVPGAGPAPAPAPVARFESRWLGTAPFCNATPADCSNVLGPGWSFVQESITGDGAACATGRKIMCSRQIN